MIPTTIMPPAGVGSVFSVVAVVVVILANLVPHHRAARSAHKRTQPRMTDRGTDQRAASSTYAGSNARIGTTCNASEQKHRK
jgi:hypothetical protein